MSTLARYRGPDWGADPLSLTVFPDHLEVRSGDYGELRHAVPFADVRRIDLREGSDSADLVVEDRAGTVFEITLERAEAREARATIRDLVAEVIESDGAL